MFRLSISRAGTKIHDLVIRQDTVTIGRKPDNDLCLKDATVSTHHAKILCEGDTRFVQDLDSTNGTYVNGERITRRALMPEDVIIIGQHKLAYLPEHSDQDTEDRVPTEQLSRRDLDKLLTSLGYHGRRSEGGAQQPKTLNWIAQDEEGVWWGFEFQPQSNHSGWADTVRGHRIRLKKESPNPNWRETLQKI